MKLYKYAALACMGLTLATTACVDDLDVKPDDPQTKLELNTTDEWYGYLGSLYGSLLYEGNISWPGYNDGDGVFMRCHWNAQELTADDAVIMNKWSDPGYNALFEQTWLDNNGWLYLCYAREADLARKATTFIDILATAGDLLTDAEKTAFAAEARVLRAFAYTRPTPSCPQPHSRPTAACPAKQPTCSWPSSTSTPRSTPATPCTPNVPKPASTCLKAACSSPTNTSTSSAAPTTAT